MVTFILVVILPLSTGFLIGYQTEKHDLWSKYF